jgi:hypothetical protein
MSSQRLNDPLFRNLTFYFGLRSSEDEDEDKQFKPERSYNAVLKSIKIFLLTADCFPC